MKRPRPWRLRGWFPVASLLLLCSAAAFANQAPVIDSFTSSAGWVLPGGTLTFTVNAHDPDCSGTCTSGCGAYIRYDLTAWSGSGGSFTVKNNGTSGSPYTASATWQAPTTTGTYTVTIYIADSGTSFGCGGRLSATASLNISVSNTPPNLPPTITSFTADKTQIQSGAQANLTCVASDPEGDPITYSWTATAGTVTAGLPGSAVFTAPDTPGAVTITCTVSDGFGGSNAATLVVSVVDAVPDRSLAGRLAAPLKVAALASGTLYVADSGASGGGLAVLDGVNGQALGFIPLSGVVSVATDWQDRLVVGGAGGAAVITTGGAVVQVLTPPEDLGAVADVAVDLVASRYVVLYNQPGRVLVFDATGTVVAAFGSNGDGPGQFKGALGVTVTPTGKLVVADAGHGLIQVFDSTGLFLSAIGGLGGSTGQFVALTGVASDASGNLYGTDSFQSQITVFNPDGTFRETLGGYGSAKGQFKTPSGVTVRPSAMELYVASTNGPSVEVYAMASTSSVQPPTTPVPLGPLTGALLTAGAPVVLTVQNASDPAALPLTYVFELDQLVGGAPVPLKTWTVPENPAGTTEVDATASIPGSGTYIWKCRAYNGTRYSNWSAEQTFQVQNPPPPTDQPPTAPVISSPDGQIELDTLAPTLVVTNATDPDGDPLYYTYEVSLLVNGAYSVVALSPSVASGTGTTAWPIPAGVLAESQHAYWRCRAFDGLLYGDWSSYGQFWTPPFAVPLLAEVGHITNGDQTRPGEVRLTFPARSTDAMLYFQVDNVTSGTELTLEVNGAHTHAVPGQVAGDWSPVIELLLPAAELNAGAANRLRFLHADLASAWGVRSVSFTPPFIPMLSATPFNTVVDLRWTADATLPPGFALRLYRVDPFTGVLSVMGNYPPGLGLVRDVGLQNGTAYTYRASYVASDGIEGTICAPVTAMPSTTYGVTPITDLKLVPSGRDLLLTWTPITSEPPLQTIEIYSDVLGKWDIDTTKFKNQIAVVAGTDGQYLDPKGYLTGPDGWYLAIPLDTAGARGTP